MRFSDEPAKVFRRRPVESAVSALVLISWHGYCKTKRLAESVRVSPGLTVDKTGERFQNRICEPTRLISGLPRGFLAPPPIVPQSPTDFHDPSVGLLLSSRLRPLTTRRFGEVDSITALQSHDQPLLGYHRHPTNHWHWAPDILVFLQGRRYIHAFFSPSMTSIMSLLGQGGTENQAGSRINKQGGMNWRS